MFQGRNFSTLVAVLTVILNLFNNFIVPCMESSNADEKIQVHFENLDHARKKHNTNLSRDKKNYSHTLNV